MNTGLGPVYGVIRTICRAQASNRVGVEKYRTDFHPVHALHGLHGLHSLHGLVHGPTLLTDDMSVTVVAHGLVHGPTLLTDDMSVQ